jgi:regulator of sirC expression with transglutaminase-like and TPR domain
MNYRYGRHVGQTRRRAHGRSSSENATIATVDKAPENAVSPVRRLFTANARRREDRIDLGLAALLIAKEEYPRMVIEDYLERLDILATGLAVEIDLEAGSEQIATTVGEYLGASQSFDGEREDYYNPRNSYLNEVMDRRLGLPITLSLLYMEVAWRVGVQLLPVPMPGHFILKLKHEEGEVYLDPFNRGDVLDVNGCRRLVETMTSAPFSPSMLAAGTKRQLLVRLLNNLKSSYLSGHDLERALRTMDLLLAITPWALDEMRDRGLLLYGLGRFEPALADLQTYVEHSPPGENRDSVEAAIRRITSA